MRLSCLRRGVAALACAAGLAAAVAAPPAPFIAISVADLDRQIGWYRETLGFELVSQRTIADRKVRFALLRRDGALLELLQIPEARPRGVVDPTAGASASRIHGFFKGGMVVSDLDVLYRRLQLQGAAFALELGERDAQGWRSFQLRDPEGNLLQFVGE